MAVNKNLQSEALRLLDFLYKIRGKKIILGQHTQTREQEELKYIESVTGELPALCGFELLGYSPNISFSDSDEECLAEVRAARGTLKNAWEWAKRGGILTFTWHWFSPLGGRDKSFFSKNTDFDVNAAIVSGTPENLAMLADLDYMAGLLKPFCDEHIPILWRPLHESEGDWFWWSSGSDEVFKKLYEIMFDRFVNRYHLDDLIWVSNTPIPQTYVGDGLADILSCDMYPPAHEHTAHSEELSKLKALSKEDKLCAAAEIGTIPDVRAVIENALPWSWFMTWSGIFCLTEDWTTKEALKSAYDYENAITLNRLKKIYR